MTPSDVEFRVVTFMQTCDSCSLVWQPFFVEIYILDEEPFLLCQRCADTEPEEERQWN